MAEKINLFEVKIETQAAIKDLAEAQTNVKKLRDEIKALSKEEGDNSVAIAKKTVELKNEQKQVSDLTRLTSAYSNVNKENISTIARLSAENSILTKKRNDLDLSTEDGRKKLIEYNTQLDKNNKFIKDNSDKLKQQKINVGNYKDSIKEAISETGQFVPGLNAASGAAKNFGAALKIALGPLGLLIAAGVALKQFFTSSEEGQNKLNKVMSVFSVILGNLSDLVSKVGEKLFSLFEEPGKALDSFVAAIKDNLIVRFEGLLNLIPKLGKAISLLFEGEFSEAAKTAGDAVAQVVLGVEDFTDKTVQAFDYATNAVSNFIKENNREAAIAAKLADLKAKTDKQERALLVERAKKESEIAELRLKAKQEDQFTSEQRLKFLQEASKLEDDIAKKEEQIGANRLFIKREQNKLSNSTKEDLNEEATLEAALILIQKKRLDAQRGLIKEINKLNREVAEENLNIAVNSIKTEIALYKISEQDKLETKQERIAKEAELNKSLAELTITDAEQLSIKLLEIETAKNTQISELNAEARLLEQEAKFEAQQNNALTEFDQARFELEQKRSLEIEYAESIGAETTAIEEKYAQDKEAIARAELDAKLSLANDFAQNVAKIAGEGTAVGKAAAVASTVISTYQSATSAFSSLSGIPIVGPVLGGVAAAAAVASGLANVKKILSVKTGLPGEKNVSAPIVSTAKPVTASVTAPKLNEGIIARESQQNTTNNDIKVQPTLVIDSVTDAQNNSSSNNTTSVI